MAVGAEAVQISVRRLSFDSSRRGLTLSAVLPRPGWEVAGHSCHVPARPPWGVRVRGTAWTFC